MDIREPKLERIPVILDTDIGTDIDDTWALAMMLQSPELDIRLITTASDNTPERAKIVAKMLEIAGRTDIPIGIGLQDNGDALQQSPWVKDYDMLNYPGTLHQDGVESIVNTIMSADKPMTIVSIGPLTNIAAALSLEPRIAEHTRFVGMHGAIYRGYDNAETAVAEYNVVRDVPAAQKVFAADWDITITPIDTCGLICLEGEKYRAICDCDTPLIKAVIESYRIWLDGKPDERSSILFDTVAAYLAFTDELLVMNREGVRITDDGYTVPDDNAKQVNCALKWKDLPAFEDFLVQRLVGCQAHVIEPAGCLR